MAEVNSLQILLAPSNLHMEKINFSFLNNKYIDVLFSCN